MTTPSVIAFARRLETDEALRKRVAAVDTADTPRMLAETTRIAAEAGFDFTAVELAASLQEHALGELPDAELDAVSGGTGVVLDKPVKKTGVADAAQVISNISKNSHDTVQGIISNLKA